MLNLLKLTTRKNFEVWISSDLKSSLHCTKVVTSAVRVLSMISRAFVTISKELFVFLYRTHAWQHLEFCVPIWSPSLAKDIDALDKVQKRATKMVRGLGNLPYEQRLKSLDCTHCFVDANDQLFHFTTRFLCMSYNPLELTICW